MASQKQIQRIQEMEACLDRAAAAITDFDRALEDFEGVQKDYQRLSDYYGSDLWMKDYEADEKGKLPPALKRGVLSEDTVYDLILQYRDLNRRMLWLVSTALDSDML